MKHYPLNKIIFFIDLIHCWSSSTNMNKTYMNNSFNIVFNVTVEVSSIITYHCHQSARPSKRMSLRLVCRNDRPPTRPLLCMRVKFYLMTYFLLAPCEVENIMAFRCVQLKLPREVNFVKLKKQVWLKRFKGSGEPPQPGLIFRDSVPLNQYGVFQNCWSNC